MILPPALEIELGAALQRERVLAEQVKYLEASDAAWRTDSRRFARQSEAAITFLRSGILKAYVHTHSATIQLLDKDDPIIADHVRCADGILHDTLWPPDESGGCGTDKGQN